MTDTIKLFNSNIIIAEDQFDLLPPCTEKKPITFLNSTEYSRYIFCCLTIVKQNNLILYRIPRGFKIYRGNTTYNKSVSKPIDKLSFHFNIEDASYEGFIHEFKSKKIIDVIAFDRVSNIEILMAKAIQENRYDIVAAIENNFPIRRIDNKKKIIIRQHNQSFDFMILDYLCSLGYYGFAYKPLNKEPAAIFLCHSDKYLSDGRQSKYQYQFITDINEL